MIKLHLNLVKYLLVLLACVIGTVAGGRRASASSCLEIPGIGALTACLDTGSFCGHTFQFTCVQYCCSGTGDCGPNGGEVCTTAGCQLGGCGAGCY